MPQFNNLSQPTTPSPRISKCWNKQLQKFLDLEPWRTSPNSNEILLYCSCKDDRKMGLKLLSTDAKWIISLVCKYNFMDMVNKGWIDADYSLQEW